MLTNLCYGNSHGHPNSWTASIYIDLNVNNYMVKVDLNEYGHLKGYYGSDTIVPIYIEMEDGIRLKRAVAKEMKCENPDYQGICLKFLKDQETYSEEKIITSGIGKRFQNDDLAECVLNIEKEIQKILEENQKERQYQV